MPIYEYEAQAPGKSCADCAKPFEVRRRMSDPPLAACPQCGNPVVRVFSAPAVGSSKSGFDDRARRAGFHKLQRLGKGEYEKRY